MRFTCSECCCHKVYFVEDVRAYRITSVSVNDYGVEQRDNYSDLEAVENPKDDWYECGDCRKIFTKEEFQKCII